MRAELIQTNQRRLRVGVFSFFLSVAGLAGIAMLVGLSEFDRAPGGESAAPQAAPTLVDRLRQSFP